MHFGQGLFLKYVAFFWFLHSCTGHACRINRRLLSLLLYFNINEAVFSVKSKRSYGRPRMLPFSKTFTFCWINDRPCKNLGTAPSLVKIISFKYFHARILARSFSSRTFFLLRTFLVGNGSSVSFFSAFWSRAVPEICRFLLVLT